LVARFAFTDPPQTLDEPARELVYLFLGQETSGGYDGIDAVLARLDEIVRGGIKHGYFEITVCGGDAKDPP
jgi:hypothetical protein